MQIVTLIVCLSFFWMILLYCMHLVYDIKHIYIYLVEKVNQALDSGKVLVGYFRYEKSI